MKRRAIVAAFATCIPTFKSAEAAHDPLRQWKNCPRSHSEQLWVRTVDLRIQAWSAFCVSMCLLRAVEHIAIRYGLLSLLDFTSVPTPPARLACPSWALCRHASGLRGSHRRSSKRSHHGETTRDRPIRPTFGQGCYLGPTPDQVYAASYILHQRLAKQCRQHIQLNVKLDGCSRIVFICSAGKEEGTIIFLLLEEWNGADAHPVLGGVTKYLKLVE